MSRDGYHDLVHRVFSPGNRRDLEPSFHSERAKVIERVCEIAALKNYQITATQMYRITGMSIASFREAFRLHTGEWPSAWILRKRRERNKHGSV